MIRTIAPSDTDNVIALGKKLGMFDADELNYLKENLTSYHNSKTRDLWYVADDNNLMGVLYCKPEPMTIGTWNIMMLLIDSDFHRQGYGTALMNHIENVLSKQGERLLVVETSSLDDFQPAQAFYRKCGYNKQARIPDFYTEGEDKIIFCKALRRFP